MDTLATMRVLSRLVTVLKGGKHSNYFQEKCNQFLNRQIPISNELSYVAPGILCMIGAYLLSDLAMAKRIYFFLKKDANSMFYRTVFFQAEYYFYGALSLLSLLERATWIEKIKYKREINHCLAVMKNLSKNCKANFYAKYALLRAEIFHCQGQLENAYVWYEKAAASAKKNRFVHIEAMIYEFIANMHYRAGNIRQSKYYAKAALKLFLRWGAEFKRIALQSKYGDLAAHFNTKIKSSVSFRTEKIEKTETREIRPGDLSAIVSSSQILSSKVLLDDLLRSLIKISLDSTAAKRAFLFLEMSQSLTPVIYCEVSDPCLMLLNKDVSNDTKKYSSKVVQYVQNTLDAIVLGNAAEESIFSTDAYITKEKVKSLFCLPILRQGNLLGLFYLENRETADVFNEGRVNTLKLLSSQAAISLENARLYGAYERFVPHEVVELLDKHSVSDIQCGDFIQKNMSILICDIRSFTTLSEKMTPAENFQLMNDYLAYTEAIILDHHGFIEKIIGDSVVAIFSYSPQDAVAAGVDLLIQLKNFNQQIRKKNIQPIKIGVGINTGNIMLGVLGNRRRIDISVLGETVERATLIQTLTKAYDTPLLVSVETQSQLFNQSAFHYRFVQKLLNHTTKEQTTIFEIYSADPEEMRFAKMAIAAHYEQAIRLYDEKNYKEALKILERCLEKLPDDKVIQYYISCCQKILGEASYSGDEILP